MLKEKKVSNLSHECHLYIVYKEPVFSHIDTALKSVYNQCGERIKSLDLNLSGFFCLFSHGSVAYAFVLYLYIFFC